MIELIAVLVILGVVGSLALPKFKYLSSSARGNGIRAARATINTTAAAVRAKAIIAGLPNDGVVRQLNMGDGVIIDVIYRNPACTANGIAKASGTQDFNWYLPGGMACTLYTNKPSSGPTVYTGGCAVRYNIYTDGTSGTWGAETGNC